MFPAAVAAVKQYVCFVQVHWLRPIVSSRPTTPPWHLSCRHLRPSHRNTASQLASHKPRRHLIWHARSLPLQQRLCCLLQCHCQHQRYQIHLIFRDCSLLCGCVGQFGKYAAYSSSSISTVLLRCFVVTVRAGADHPLTSDRGRGHGEKGPYRGVLMALKGPYW